jgi:hypothetical protein
MHGSGLPTIELENEVVNERPGRHGQDSAAGVLGRGHTTFVGRGARGGGMLGAAAAVQSIPSTMTADHTAGVGAGGEPRVLRLQGGEAGGEPRVLRRRGGEAGGGVGTRNTRNAGERAQRGVWVRLGGGHNVGTRR